MDTCIEKSLQVSSGSIPVRRVILVDDSGSMLTEDMDGTRIAAACEAMNVLIDETSHRYRQDEIGIVRFSNRAAVIHPLINIEEGTSSLKNSLTRFGQGGSTNMTAGLELAGGLLKGFPTRNILLGRVIGWFGKILGTTADENPQDNRQWHIILLSDGYNTCPKSPLGIADFLKSEGIVIDCIGIGNHPSKVDEKLLRNIASRDEQGRPRYSFIGDKGNLIRKFEQLTNRLRQVE